MHKHQHPHINNRMAINYNDDYKVFIGGFPIDLTKDQLHDYMLKYGRIRATRLHRNRNGESKGFGFVEFEDLESVERALNATHIINGKEFKSRRVIPQEEARLKDQELKLRKVFLTGLSTAVGEIDLGLYFSKFGYVEQIILSRDHLTGESRCCGFVVFGDVETANKVLNLKRSHKIKKKTFRCKPCKLRSEMEQRGGQNQSDNFYNTDPNFGNQGPGYGYEMPMGGYQRPQNPPSRQNFQSNFQGGNGGFPSQMRPNQRYQQQQGPQNQFPYAFGGPGVGWTQNLAINSTKQKNKIRAQNVSKIQNQAKKNNKNNNNKGKNSGKQQKMKKKKKTNKNNSEFYYSSFLGYTRIYNTDGIRKTISKSLSEQQFILRTQLRGTSTQLGEEEFKFMVVQQNLSLFNFMNIPLDFPFDEDDEEESGNGNKNNKKRSNEKNKHMKAQDKRGSQPTQSGSRDDLLESLTYDLTLEQEIDSWWAAHEAEEDASKEGQNSYQSKTKDSLERN